ncbi:MAG: sulfate adenylyltransferase, partial [Planctomycetota bacterium]
MVKLNTPYGGELVNLMVADCERDSLMTYAKTLPSIQLSQRLLCDLELLATGAFSPLNSFMGRKDYESVLDTMRLSTGELFPIPITLPVPDDLPIYPFEDYALTDQRNNILAIISITEVYEWELDIEARQVYGTLDTRHPLVAEMYNWPGCYVTGILSVLRLPSRYDFAALRLTPEQTRSHLTAMAGEGVVAFQTRNPLHRAHEELTNRAADKINGALLIHPVVGLTKPGDIDHYSRVRSYKALFANYYDNDRVLLALLPLAMRMAGPREALWHMIIRRNYGATHFIIGRDHAGPGLDSNGNLFYDEYEAQELAEQYADEIGVGVVPFNMMVYLTDERRYEE